LPRATAIAKADALLDKVGLLAKRDNYPGRLSGGQKQRVAIARALAMEPDIMLFDEPTSALDPELTVEVLRTMRQLAEEHMTMLVVTHEMGFAREVAHRVIFMDDGRVVESADSARFFSAPQHERTRTFLGQMLWTGYAPSPGCGTPVPGRRHLGHTDRLAHRSIDHRCTACPTRHPQTSLRAGWTTPRASA